MKVSEAILSTLAYHDIFDYPLTSEETHKYLIGKKASKKSISSALVILASSNVILSEAKNLKQNYLYALRSRNKIFRIRRQREKYSEIKLKHALFFSKLLTLIPTIRLVAVSGALAMENSPKTDDIDLLIVTSKNNLWTTRFLANILLIPFKRSPGDKKKTDRACLNLFVDEKQLRFQPKNLYIAHEICQLKPIWDRNKTYSQLIKANVWVKKFLPNWEAPSPVIPAYAGIHPKNRALYKKSVVSGQLSIVERILRSFQLSYMRSKISTERIGEHQLFFHPTNTQNWVLEEYQKRLKTLKLS